ncbi:MAG TPA: cache domain-containing protein [Capillibacterium sp.]
MVLDLQNDVSQPKGEYPAGKSEKKQTNGLIRNRLLCFFLLVSLAPILIIGFLAYNKSKAAIAKKITQYSQAELGQSVANIQNKLAEFENISVRLFINKGFNSTLATLVAAEDEDRFLQAKKEVEFHFKEYMISNPDIFGFMFICDPDVERSVVITKEYYDEFMDLTKNFKEQSAYRNIMAAGGGIVWSSAIKINRSHFVLLGRYLKDMTTGESLGILAIIVDEENIDQLVNLNIYNRLYISLAEIQSYSLVINNEGEIVSTPFKEDIGKRFSDIIKETKPLDELFSLVSDRDYGSEISQGSFITEVNARETLVTFKTIGSTTGIGGKSGWHLISLAPTSYLYADVRMLGVTILLLGVVFAAIAVWFSFYVTSLIDQHRGL